VKLLVDNQLPAALARFLVERGFACRHVLDLGMAATDDQEIWQLAKDEQLVIVSKDEDFARFADRDGEAAAQVIWVRIGNCRKAALLTAFDSVLPQCGSCSQRARRLSRSAERKTGTRKTARKTGGKPDFDEVELVAWAQCSGLLDQIRIHTGFSCAGVALPQKTSGRFAFSQGSSSCVGGSDRTS
jgi:predicted nuclease of predicted toxin-antitoxin system